jgi:hypothetical protein
VVLQNKKIPSASLGEENLVAPLIAIPKMYY